MSHPFAEAVRSGDHTRVEALLADDIVFTSPVVFKPYEGKPAAILVLRLVAGVFENFHYLREVVDGDTAVLEFEATVDGRTVNGVDIIHTDADGRIDDLKVMVRPLSGINALATRMAAALEAAGGQAA